MSKIISHNTDPLALDDAVREIRARLASYDNVSELNEILDELCTFEFGRYLIMSRGGWNGYWTWYAITRPQRDEPYSCQLEEFIFTRAPTVLATRERFGIFQTLVQNEVIDEASLASVPCGVMGDLLSLDLRDVRNVTLTGIDLDPESLELAGQLAHSNGLADRVHLQQGDAWQLDAANAFDMITSNGLNVYEPDDSSVTELYRSFHRALRPGGCLITSFISPPPALTDDCEWDMDVIDASDLELQRKVLIDVLEAPWACYRTEATTRAQLEEAGFRMVEVYWGSSRIFPTVTAIKMA